MRADRRLTPALRLATSMWLALGTGVTACGGLSDSLRARAAADMSCDESRLEGENLGPRSVRVTGCGKSAIYACKQAAPGPEPREVQVSEAEARQGNNAGAGPCAWTRVK